MKESEKGVMKGKERKGRGRRKEQRKKRKDKGVKGEEEETGRK